MLQGSYIENDVSTQLVSLLSLRPVEVEVHRTAVLTTEPAVWSSDPDSETHEILDLSVLLGLRRAKDPDTSTASKPESDPHFDSVIVDFTIPFDMKLSPNTVLRDLASPLASTVPAESEAIDLPFGKSSVQQLLLAWAASQPSVHAISAVTPSSLIMDPTGEWLRQYLSTRLNLCAVIELPTDILRPLTSGGVNVLFFGGSRSDVYFDSLGSRGDFIDMESRPWFQSLRGFMDRPPRGSRVPPPATDRVLEPPTEPASGEAREAVLEGAGDASDRVLKEAAVGYAVPRDSPKTWSVDVSATEIAETRRRIQRLGEIVALKDLCTIVQGANRLHPVLGSEDGIPLVEAHVLKEGVFDADSAMRVDPKTVPERCVTQLNDLLLALNLSDRFSVARNGYRSPAALSGGTVALRLTTDAVSPEYLFEYMSSSTARKLLAALAEDSGSSSQQVSIESLLEFPVPVVDRERAKGLGEVQTIEGALRRKADELQSMRRSLFDERNSRDFNEHLDQLRRRGKVLAVSMQSLESLNQQIATTYPFPLAYGYRLLESSRDPRDWSKDQFRFAENMLAFLGSVCLALLRAEDRKIASLDPGRPMTMGKWRDVVTHSSEALRTYQDNRLALDISALNIGSQKKGSFGGHVEEIVVARNEWAHMRGLEDTLDACRTRQDRLRECMKSLGFLTDFPIVHIEDASHERNGDWHLRCLVYRGDHPALQHERLVLHSDLPPGDDDVFLDFGDERWVSVYPFITSQTCQQCKSKEIYYIDSWNAEKGVVRIKSFERGHTESAGGISSALGEFGPARAPYIPPADG
jgi:hypothetical protein